MSLAPRRGVLRVMLTAAGAGALGRLGLAATPSPREIPVQAQRFSFTPREIPIRVGERVVILLRSQDYAHGFSVPDLGLRVDLVPDRVVRLELQPNTAGKLEFLCDNFCGDEHEDMHGWLLVVG
jgi:cytochrome c oxidase subunit 2